MMRKVFLQEGLPAVLRVAVPHVRGVPAADRFLKHNPQPQTTSPAPAEVQGMSVSVCAVGGARVPRCYLIFPRNPIHGNL